MRSPAMATKREKRPTKADAPESPSRRPQGTTPRSRFGYRVTPQTAKRVTILFAAAWTTLIAVVMATTIANQHDTAIRSATITAEAKVTKDIVYRRWNSISGGVYAPISDTVVPNPYLTIPERDVTTTDGVRLTMINPAYMTRIAHEIGFAFEGIRGHITSLNPIRPANAPDPWETEALQGFQSGDDTRSAVVKIAEVAFLRFMRPLVTEESCLRCHAHQGYELGDIRGGISVTVPMAPFQTIAARNIRAAMVGYGLFWTIGLSALGVGMRRIVGRLRTQIDDEETSERLLKERELMLREVQHRIKNNMTMMASLVYLKADATDDEEHRQSLMDLSERFKVMMILYDQLSQARDPDRTTLEGYLPLIARQIVSFSPASARITVETDIDPVSLETKTLSTIGVLAAEVVTNSVKYAFPGERSGTIRIVGRVVGDQVRLEIADDGVGLGSGGEHEEGLGLRLVHALSEQIGGTAEVRGDDGTSVLVVFPRDGDTTAG